jgi:glycosyltransferase involved in cell wall biosynthesis
MDLEENLFVSVVTVVSDDSDIIEESLGEVASVLESRFRNYELVIVDDGLRGGTPEFVPRFLASHDCIRYMRLSRPFGKEIAFSAGLDTVIGDVVVIMDIESDPPDLIPAMIAQVQEVHGVVFGVATNRRDVNSVSYFIAAEIYQFLCRRILPFAPPRNASYFIGLTRDTLNAVLRIKNRYQHLFLRLFSPQIGFSTGTMEYEVHPKRSRLLRTDFAESVRLALSSLITNSAAPLRAAAGGGLIVSACAFVYMLFTARGPIAQLEILTSGMFTMLFLILLILSEYLISLITATRQHPQYFVEKELNSNIMIVDRDSRRNVDNSSDGQQSAG